jgi:fluoroacetyl-CoA thioesterase
MKQIFSKGDKKIYRKIVTSEDFASFHGQVVHRVYSTYSLARDAEWTTRQFVLDLRDEDEEGIGTFISLEHSSPAFEGEEVTWSGYIDEINNNEVICTVEARAGNRIIATGKTGQKIIKREKIMKLFQQP